LKSNKDQVINTVEQMNKNKEPIVVVYYRTNIVAV
jgi:hypothetical protein